MIYRAIELCHQCQINSKDEDMPGGILQEMEDVDAELEDFRLKSFAPRQTLPIGSAPIVPDFLKASLGESGAPTKFYSFE